MMHIQAASEYRERKRIARIQEQLNRLGAALHLTGRLDRPTRDALAAVQRRAGLRVTRRLDQATLELLKHGGRKTRDNREPITA